MSLKPEKPSPLAPGYRLDRYEFLCPIAEGGMASVWVARLQGKHGFEKLLAIKTILSKYSSDDQFRQMFLDEARIACSIEHANVAQIFDLGEEQGILYLVMEWVDGDALTKLQSAVKRKGRLMPYGISLRIMADACGGLHAAHELRGKDGANLGVVHRDISPQNILVTAKGSAKVIDFGIAKARDRLAGETSAGMLKGKVKYMAPEQALGLETDRRADVWAVGAVLYHLLAGEAPFDGANQLATLHMLVSGQSPPPLPDAVPDPIRAVISKALSHDPAKRYTTAAELQRALEQTMVDTGLGTSVADVAEFNEEMLAARATARKTALDLALGAAAERERVYGLLKPTADDISSSNQINRKVLTLSLAPIAPAAALQQQASLAAAARLEPVTRLAHPSDDSSSTLGTVGGSMTTGVNKAPTGGSREVVRRGSRCRRRSRCVSFSSSSGWRRRCRKLRRPRERAHVARLGGRRGGAGCARALIARRDGGGVYPGVATPRTDKSVRPAQAFRGGALGPAPLSPPCAALHCGAGL